MRSACSTSSAQDNGHGGRGWTLRGRRRRRATPAETTEPGAEQEETRSPLTDSNRRPPPYHGGALPTELRGRGTECSPGSAEPVTGGREDSKLRSAHARGAAARRTRGQDRAQRTRKSVSLAQRAHTTL